METVKRLNAGWKILLGVAVGSVVILLFQLIGGGDDPAAPAAAPASSSAAPTSHRPVGPTMNPIPGKAYKIDDCSFCVTPPGTWQTGGAPTDFGGVCEWIVQRDLVVGDPSSVVKTGTTGPGIPARVSVEVGQYFTSTNCQPWRYVG